MLILKDLIHLAICHWPTGLYLHTSQKSVLLREGRLEGQLDLCKDVKQLLKRRGIQSRAQGILVKAFWLCLSGFMPKVFRRQMKSFTVEIAIRNQSIRQCCLGHSSYWAPLHWMTVGVPWNKAQ